MMSFFWRDLEEFIESLSLNKAIAKIHQLTNLCLAKKSTKKTIMWQDQKAFNCFYAKIAYFLADFL